MKCKRIYMVLIMVVCCVFVFAACKKSVGTPEDNAVTEQDDTTKEDADSEDADEEEADESTIESDAYTFGFSGIDMENPYFIILEKATREVLEDKDYRMITEDPASSSDTHAS